MFDISIDYTLASVFEPWGFPPSQDKRAETSKIYVSFIERVVGPLPLMTYDLKLSLKAWI